MAQIKHPTTAVATTMISGIRMDDGNLRNRADPIHDRDDDDDDDDEEGGGRSPSMGTAEGGEADGYAKDGPGGAESRSRSLLRRLLGRGFAEDRDMVFLLLLLPPPPLCSDDLFTTWRRIE